MSSSKLPKPRQWKNKTRYSQFLRILGTIQYLGIPFCEIFVSIRYLGQIVLELHKVTFWYLFFLDNSCQIHALIRSYYYINLVKTLIQSHITPPQLAHKQIKTSFHYNKQKWPLAQLPWCFIVFLKGAFQCRKLTKSEDHTIKTAAVHCIDQMMKSPQLVSINTEYHTARKRHGILIVRCPKLLP